MALCPLHMFMTYFSASSLPMKSLLITVWGRNVFLLVPLTVCIVEEKCCSQNNWDLETGLSRHHLDKTDGKRERHLTLDV